MAYRVVRKVLTIWGCGHGSYERATLKKFLRIWLPHPVLGDSQRQQFPFQSQVRIYNDYMPIAEYAKLISMPGAELGSMIRPHAFWVGHLDIYPEDASDFRCPKCRTSTICSMLLKNRLKHESSLKAEAKK